MPEYLAPGVYVEETSHRATAIEGVPTSTAGFVGATRYGPTDRPLLVTSLAEYERAFEPFGVEATLHHADAGETPNFLWYAARSFFDEGGRRLVVARVFRRLDGEHDDGHARVDQQRTGGVFIRARYPGAAGNVVVRLSLVATVRPPREYDLVWLQPHSAPSRRRHGLHMARRAASGSAWRFERAGRDAAAVFARLIGAEGMALEACADRAGAVCVVALTLAILGDEGRREVARWEGLPLDPRQAGGDGAAGGLFSVFAEGGAASERPAEPSIVVGCDPARVGDACQALTALFGAGRDHRLEGGNDGCRPRAEDFAGESTEASARRLGLRQLEDIDEVSIVAAPGSSWPWPSGGDDPGAIAMLLVDHAARLRYRIAVLDAGPGQSVASLRILRARVASARAVLYLPCVEARDPLGPGSVSLPPSGFIAGVYARVDARHGVHRAAGEEPLLSATGLERLFSVIEHDALVHEGFGTLRFFPGDGVRVWGARTTSDDPDWKYVNVRRYLSYVERSIDVGVRWAVFEPNGEALWERLRRTVADFLSSEWRNGALTGDRPDAAFFVRCDRTTMTQDDIDHGRLVCLIGVAPSKPSEFVIFRIGQWTADRDA
ncbi:MAG: phage tail sheath C-terminal domain-containing protein [Caldimonas sp.]